jgi:hypothetical protein
MSARTNAQAIADLTVSVNAILAHLGLDQPAQATAPVTPPAQPAKPADNEFVTWLRATAEQRAERKVTNKALAADLDAKRPGWRGAANRERIWAAAKAGKRLPKVA